MYRSGTNIETATRHLAAVLKELHTDPLLTKMFGKQPLPELFYIEWVDLKIKFIIKVILLSFRFENI